jgi:hypothetical protein
MVVACGRAKARAPFGLKEKLCNKCYQNIHFAENLLILISVVMDSGQTRSVNKVKSINGSKSQSQWLTGSSSGVGYRLGTYPVTPVATSVLMWLN